MCDRCEKERATETVRCWLGCPHEQCFLCAAWTAGEAHDWMTEVLV